LDSVSFPNGNQLDHDIYQKRGIMKNISDKQPTIKKIESKTLIGMSSSMSVAKDKTFNLFSTFMPRRKEIPHRLNSETLDLRVYSEDYFQEFSPVNEFIKWALVEVSKVENMPPGMETFILHEGDYAVFHRKGSTADKSIFQYIFTSWLPNADYLLDDRPHFEVLGPKTKLNDPESEEEIWIPVRFKH
jgi:AraC family transcriptional regulator